MIDLKEISRSQAAIGLERMTFLLATPENWIKGVLSRDAAGDVVPIDSPSACRFCLFGAAIRAYPYDGINSMTEIFANWLDTMMMQYKHVYGIVIYNDDPATTFADIKGFLAYCKAHLPPIPQSAARG